MLWIIILFLIGLPLTIFALLLLLNKDFLKKTRENMSWKNTPYFGRDSYIYDKYGRGLKILIVGLLMLGYAIYLLLR